MSDYLNRMQRRIAWQKANADVPFVWMGFAQTCHPLALEAIGLQPGAHVDTFERLDRFNASTSAFLAMRAAIAKVTTPAALDDGGAYAAR